MSCWTFAGSCKHPIISSGYRRSSLACGGRLTERSIIAWPMHRCIAPPGNASQGYFHNTPIHTHAHTLFSIREETRAYASICPSDIQLFLGFVLQWCRPLNNNFFKTKIKTFHEWQKDLNYRHFSLYMYKTEKNSGKSWRMVRKKRSDGRGSS